MAFFKMMNRIGLLQGQADIIEPIDHAVLAKSVDLEVQQVLTIVEYEEEEKLEAVELYQILDH